MRTRNEFVEYLIDQLTPLGDVAAKSMFGGYGIYCDDVMFGFIADDEFFLKVDDESRPEYERDGFGPFIYTKNGRSSRGH